MKQIIRFLQILLLLISFSSFSQNNPEELAEVQKSKASSNIGKMLLEGANEGKLKLLKFEDFGGTATEITVSSVKIFDEEWEGFEWEESELYYEGDLISYEGKQYGSLEDNNEGNIPGQSESWEEFVEVWVVIDDINSFLYEKDRTSIPEYFHLYYQDLNDEFNMPKYLASFEANPAVEYLNNSGLVYYQTNENGHLQGSVFLEISSNLFIETANKAGLELSEEDISSLESVNRWWATTRNFSLGDKDQFRFLYADDSVMWETSLAEVVEMAGVNKTEFILIGDALSTGIAFDNSQNAKQTINRIDQIQTMVTERFMALDSMFLLKNSGKTNMPVSTTGISSENWSSFVEKILDGARNGQWTPYTSESLEKEMTVKDLEYRMMIYEEDAVDFDFSFDQWNKNVTYYSEDVIEYAGLLYESVKENNVDHIPEQWPEYWKEKIVNTESYYPDELRNVKVSSELVFDSSGRILSVTPRSFCLEIPGSIVETGFNKEIAWFDLDQIGGVDDPSFNELLDIIKSHNFYAELLSYQPLRQYE